MVRLTQKNEEGHAFYPECFARCGGVGSSDKCDHCDITMDICEKLATYEDNEESGRVQIMDCTGCIHKGNKQFCLNCKRGGCRDYYLVEE